MGFRKYSAGLKYSAVLAWNDGKSLTEINDSLGASISADSITRWAKLYRDTRAVVCDPQLYQARGRPFDLSDDDLQFIKELIKDKPTIYIDEIQQSLSNDHNVNVSSSTISKTLRNRLKMSKKCVRVVNPKQDPDQRAEFTSLIASVPVSCLVFTDESGVCLEVVSRKKGWVVIGERTKRVPRERSRHQYNIIPAISSTGLVAHMVQEESVDRLSFEYFLEHILVPSMNPFPAPRSVLVLDNAQIHHHGRVAPIVESRGCLLQYLPPYSPDFNPIEKGFSVYKSTLRRYEDLLTGGDEDYDVIEGFISLVFTADLTRKLFRGAGYPVE